MQFAATVTNDVTNQGVSWSLQETVNGSLVPCTSAAVCGTLSAKTTASSAPITYTAPTAAPAGNFEVGLVATALVDSTAIGEAFVTLPGILVAVDPTIANVEAEATQRFTATVTNDKTGKGVAWTLSENGVACSPACGTIKPATTASGVATTYTAPATPPASDLSVTVTASSQALSAAAATATVTVPAIVVSVGPASALLPLNASQTFAAMVANDPTNQGVSWQLTQGGTACAALACGTVAPPTTASGIATTYTAPATLPVNKAVTLSAISPEDATKTAVATITLTAGTVKIVPDSLDFGRVLVNTTSTPQQVPITNTGGAALNITSITIGGATPASFAQTNDCGNSIAAGTTCTITARFTPHGLGLVHAVISISDGSVDSPQQVGLSGTGFTRRPGILAAARSLEAALGTMLTPLPTGPETVGTRVLHMVDKGRNDPYQPWKRQRDLLVRLWYPASLKQACQPAEYTAPAVWNYFAQLLGISVPPVITNSCLNAPMTEFAHPVVLFTHGYTGTFTDYTFLFEDLASRGYVVASINHTYEATVTAFPGGRLEKSVLGSHLNDTWKGDNETLTFATSVRLQDLRFVRAELERLNAERDSFLAGRLDLRRIAVAGHSMGGAAALLAVDRDKRYRAGIILDGHLPPPFIRPTTTPVLLLGTGDGNWSEDQCGTWSNLRGTRAAVYFTGGEHVMFSDGVWLARGVIRTGVMNPDETIAAVRGYVAAFLDANVRGEATTPLLGQQFALPQAAVTTQKQSLCER